MESTSDRTQKRIWCVLSQWRAMIGATTGSGCANKSCRGEKGPPVWQHRRLFASCDGEQPTKEQPHRDANARFTMLDQNHSSGRMAGFDFVRIEIHFQLTQANYDWNRFLSSIFSKRDYFLQPRPENGIVARILNATRRVMELFHKTY